MINLHHIAYPLQALGPGRRAGVWLAGCERKCPGCMSPDLQSNNSGRHIDVDQLARRLTDIDIPLHGVTISGGEPLDQPLALSRLLTILAGRRPQWNVLVYTGYTLSKLKKAPERLGALEQVDVLIDGAYLENVAQCHPLAGSGNQRVLPLTKRGAKMLEDLESATPPRFDLGLGPEGAGRLIGVAEEKVRLDVLSALARDSP